MENAIALRRGQSGAMTVIPQPFHGLASLQVWWPDSADQVFPLLSAAPVVSVMQCSEAVAEPLQAYAFRRRPFQTLLIDLQRPETELWQQIHPRYRSYINQTRRMGCRVLVNEKIESALELINGFMRRRGFRRPLSQAEWRRTLAHCDVFLIKRGDVTQAARVVLVHDPLRARYLFGATADRSDPEYRRFVGPLNRYLFWHEFMHYKARGLRWYDLGGLVLDPMSPLYSISRFKMAFGGTVVTEHTLRLAGNPLARSFLRGAESAWRRWRAWQQALGWR